MHAHLSARVPQSATSANRGPPARQVTHFTSDHIYVFAFSRDRRRVAFTRGNDKQDAIMLRNFR